MRHVEAFFTTDPPPTSPEVTEAFYHACEGDQREAAECLLGRGADINWVPPWGKGTPLDRARKRNREIGDRSRAEDMVMWLVGQGAKCSVVG
jgi:hypothetical protein